MYSVGNDNHACSNCTAPCYGDARGCLYRMKIKFWAGRGGGEGGLRLRVVNTVC